MRKALAFPSKWVMSSQNFLLTLSLTASPAPSVKKVWMAFSPEWPNGGLPKSWARQAALTMVPISSKRVSFNSGRFSMMRREISLPSDIPTLATSRLWVRRLCTKMLPGRGNTWVLFCKRRKAEEKIRRS